VVVVADVVGFETRIGSPLRGEVEDTSNRRLNSLIKELPSEYKVQ